MSGRSCVLVVSPFDNSHDVRRRATQKLELPRSSQRFVILSNGAWGKESPRIRINSRYRLLNLITFCNNCIG
eukprot:6236067-Amphidinium_carterae.1